LSITAYVPEEMPYGNYTSRLRLIFRKA